MIRFVGNAWDVHGHLLTVDGNGVVGPCDCPDFQNRKAVHGGWCKHRLALSIFIGQDRIAQNIESMAHRLDRAKKLLQ